MAGGHQGDATVRAAQQLADAVLFPAALATDRADVLPREGLDALADAGLYGLPGPTWAGGADADFATVYRVIEALASGCLTTAFVWSQHLNAVRGVTASENPAVRELLEPLCRGALRAGVALDGARPGPASLLAARTDGGWRLSGAAQRVSGWGRIQVIHAAARTDGDAVVWGLIDADPSLPVQREQLIALNATATVRVDLDGCVVPDARVTSVVPHADPDPAEPGKLRAHAALALGVTARCCTLIGPSPLDAALSACRDVLDRADTAGIHQARAASSALALRASSTLVSVVGSRALLTDRHEQRLAREALFAAVFAARPPVRAALLDQLGATPFAAT